ncbi:MAG: 1-acyl-sn-glycerol-3-phosphate acyltransferase [Pseudomonadota bacterium]
MFQPTKDDPLDQLLRARLRIPEGANKRLMVMRWAMTGFDALNRAVTGQPFFALRETREKLIELDGSVGDELIRAVLDMNGGTRITAHGLQNVPQKGRVLIASTHPIGTFDFIAHAGALLKHRPDLKVVAGREAERFLGKDRLIAVDLDRHDKVTTPRSTREQMIAHLEREGCVLIFGSGRVPDTEGGLLKERGWRTGTTRTSELCNAPIVPASADMRNSRHYYRTRKLFSFLSGGNKEVGRRVASLRYISELMSKLGGSYDVHYGPIQPAGTAPEVLQELAENLVPGLYR